MKTYSTALVVALAAGLLCLAGCTELNPSYQPDASGLVVKYDQGQHKLDGAPKWLDHQVPGDQFVPPVDQFIPPVDQFVPPVDQFIPPVDQDTTCPPGQVRCDGKCIDPAKDIFNCGQCGNQCKSSEACMLGLCCNKSQANCNGQCINLQSDVNNCGKCGLKCNGKLCMDGICCNKDQANCNGQCVNLQSDVNNCGKCGVKCPAGQKCDTGKCAGTGPTSGCADGTEEQKFKQGMVGCGGTAKWADRATLCASSSHRVCTADEWVQRRDGNTPIYNYWTNSELRYFQSFGGCGVSTTQGTKCPAASGPMRVCASKKDPLGNTCNWTGCGYKTTWPNQYFGGCSGNTTAGALCCPK